MQARLEPANRRDKHVQKSTPKSLPLSRGASAACPGTACPACGGKIEACRRSFWRYGVSGTPHELGLEDEHSAPEDGEAKAALGRLADSEARCAQLEARALRAEERALREGLLQGRARLTDLLAGRQSDDMEAHHSRSVPLSTLLI